MSDITINEAMGTQFAAAMQDWSDTRPRSLQAAEGHLGMSDILGCREYARLRTVGTEPTDSRSTWAADVGTAIHTIVEEAVLQRWPGKALASVGTTITFPSGSSVPGTADLVFPDWNTVVDIKTVNGLATIRKDGPSLRHWTQVTGYASGLIADGILNDNEPKVALVYFDRSGKDDKPIAFERPYDPMLLVDADHWIEDVIYSVKHGENASKDKPINWCEQWCEFFTACRGLDAAPEGGLIDDADTVNMVDQYAEAMRMERLAKQLKDEAKEALLGVQGSTGQYTVRWTRVNESEVPGYVRNGYDKIEVRPVRRKG